MEARLRFILQCRIRLIGATVGVRSNSRSTAYRVAGTGIFLGRLWKNWNRTRAIFRTFYVTCSAICVAPYR
ncbi:hypothetical protein CC80DRAFT_495206 [Byssothecium circinans]|uniref:Uncharacterized protein n=1 Tax=Byssothecium circinans TaxID=147558 RepID=A0A6A5TLU9_9PLEO|nr:hypothetical protein CC80DRAFT_495206 [Byssothecium circinans]